MANMRGSELLNRVFNGDRSLVGRKFKAKLGKSKYDTVVVVKEFFPEGSITLMEDDSVFLDRNTEKELREIISAEWEDVRIHVTWERAIKAHYHEDKAVYFEPNDGKVIPFSKGSTIVLYKNMVDGSGGKWYLG